MNAIDSLGAIGDVFSYLGIICGLPLIAISVLIKVMQGPYIEKPVTIITEDGGMHSALWSFGDRTYTRKVEAHESTNVVGYVSQRAPHKMRFERRSSAARVCSTLGIVLLSTALLGFLVSLLPIFV